MALKSSREGLRKELVDYLGNIIIDDNLRNEIIKVVGDNFVTSESLNETVNNLTMQITTESGERVEADTTLQNNITAEATARENADTILQNNINAETTARQEAITNLEGMIGTSGLQMDLLWTNASPTSAFAPQTISLDFTNYKMLYFEFLRQNNNQDDLFSYILLSNKSYYCMQFNNVFMARQVTIGNNEIIFADCINFASYNGVNTVTNNNFSIPHRIFGIK